jgi:L-histidine N-alpha-methyltransferase
MTSRLESAGEGDGKVRIAQRITVEIRQRIIGEAEELAEIRKGLDAPEPWVSSKYFYDEHGSILFDRITELEEYYQTRAERSILERTADEIARISSAHELLELGSGTSTKTRVLLDALQRAGTLEWYMPFEVSEETVRKVADELVVEYPELSVHAVVGDFTSTLPYMHIGGQRLVILLGGTIGNFTGDEAHDLLSELSTHMHPGEFFLLGVDIIKDPARIEAAYNDAQGLTAEFNRNILRVLNGKLDADFDPDGFEHVAFYDREAHRIEMRLRSNRDQVVHARKLGASYRYPRGAELRTEISVKYDRDLARDLLARSGFLMQSFYTDEENLFGLALAVRQG